MPWIKAINVHNFYSISTTMDKLLENEQKHETITVIPSE